MRVALGTDGGRRSRLGLLALAAALATVLALALPSGASAAKFSFTVHKVGKGTVKCEVAGTGTVGTCASSYVEGTELVLYPTPETGYVFLGWTDEYCEFYGAEPCELTLEEATIVTAEFGLPPKFPLTVELTGSGAGTVKCEVVGSGVAGPCAAEYQEGTELNLYATPSPGSVFVEWTDGYCSFYGAEPCELTLEEATIVTAEFGLPPKFPLTVTFEGSGAGTVKCEVVGSGVAGPCAAEYPEGTKLKLVAVASPGSKFVEWSGECDIASGSKCELEVNEGRTVVAVFEALPPAPFTVLKAGTGTGTVTCDGGACASSYSEGRELTLAATPAAGSSFAGWSGGGCAGAAGCKVTIKAGLTVTATFNLNPTPPPTRGAAKAAGAARVRGRNAALKLSCSGRGPCSGALKLTAKIKQGKRVRRMTIGSASFDLAVGASKTLAVKISAAARKQLLRNGTLNASLSGTGIASSTVKLKHS